MTSRWPRSLGMTSPQVTVTFKIFKIFFLLFYAFLAISHLLGIIFQFSFFHKVMVTLRWRADGHVIRCDRHFSSDVNVTSIDRHFLRWRADGQSQYFSIFIFSQSDGHFEVTSRWPCHKEWPSLLKWRSLLKEWPSLLKMTSRWPGPIISFEYVSSPART